jgi:hypothetical protein
MGSKKQGSLHRTFTQPDLSKIELKSKVCGNDLILWLWNFTRSIFGISRIECLIFCYFSSLMQSLEGYRSTVPNTWNSRTFILLSNSYIVWKKFPLRCGILIQIGSYCLSTITIIWAQHYSMLTRDYDLYYSDKVIYTSKFHSSVSLGFDCIK